MKQNLETNRGFPQFYAKSRGTSGWNLEPVPIGSNWTTSKKYMFRKFFTCIYLLWNIFFLFYDFFLKCNFIVFLAVPQYNWKCLRYPFTICYVRMSWLHFQSLKLYMTTISKWAHIGHSNAKWDWYLGKQRISYFHLSITQQYNHEFKCIFSSRMDITAIYRSLCDFRWYLKRALVNWPKYQIAENCQSPMKITWFYSSRLKFNLLSNIYCMMPCFILLCNLWNN